MGGRTDSPGSFAALLDSSYFEQKSLAKRLNSETKAQIPIACKRGQNGAEIVRNILLFISYKIVIGCLAITFL